MLSRLIRPCEPRWIIWRSSWKIQCVVSATLSQGWRKINYLKLMIFKLISSAFFSVQVFVIICLNFNFCFFFLFVLKNVDARKILNMALQLFFFYQILVELPGIDQVTHIYYRVYPRLVIHHDFPRGIKKNPHNFSPFHPLPMGSIKKNSANLVQLFERLHRTYK